MTRRTPEEAQRLHERVCELRAQGQLYKDIGKKLGITTSAAAHYGPNWAENQAKSRRYKEAHRALIRERDKGKHLSQGRTCKRCDRPITNDNAHGVCQPCDRVEAQAWREHMALLWREGLSTYEIAERVARPHASMCQTVAKARAAGRLDMFPYRYNDEWVEAIKEGYAKALPARMAKARNRKRLAEEAVEQMPAQRPRELPTRPSSIAEIPVLSDR